MLGYAGISFIPILIIAAIAIPNLLRARMAANEASAVGSLRTIVTAAIVYQHTYSNCFAPGLRAMDGLGTGEANCDRAQLIDSILASGRKSSYDFTYVWVVPKGLDPRTPSPEAAAKGCTSTGGASFEVNADPITRGTTGQRSFFTDQTGVIRYETRSAATADSPPIE